MFRDRMLNMHMQHLKNVYFGFYSKMVILAKKYDINFLLAMFGSSTHC